MKVQADFISGKEGSGAIVYIRLDKKEVEELKDIVAVEGSSAALKSSAPTGRALFLAIQKLFPSKKGMRSFTDAWHSR
ncbi:MAG: hypothetical protein ISS87_00715 [Candidatus Pacebacteria bacterium]|nr:hypothetical protein [Candidatus Paceibacterota bacterium]